MRRDMGARCSHRACAGEAAFGECDEQTAEHQRSVPQAQVQASQHVLRAHAAMVPPWSRNVNTMVSGDVETRTNVRPYLSLLPNRELPEPVLDVLQSGRSISVLSHYAS